MGQLCATKHPADINAGSDKKPNSVLSHKQKNESFIKQWLIDEKNKNTQQQIPQEELQFIFGLEQFQQGQNNLVSNEFLTIVQKNENKLSPEDFNNCGVVLEVIGNYEQAEKYFFKALDKIKEGENHVICLKNLGTIYQKLNDLEKTINYFQECIQFIKHNSLEKKDNQDLGYIYNNLGQILLEQQKEKEAQQCFAECLQIWQQILNRQFGNVSIIDWFNCMQNSTATYPIIKQNNIVLNFVKQTIEQLIQNQIIEEVGNLLNLIFSQESLEVLYIMNQYARIFQKFFLYESSYICAQECLSLSKKYKQLIQIIFNRIIPNQVNYDKIVLTKNLGYLNFLLCQLENCVNYLEESSQLFDKIPYSEEYEKEQAFLTQILALVFKQLGVVQKADIYKNRAQKITKKLQQKYLFQ